MTVIKPLAETTRTVTLRRADFESLVRAAEDAEDLAAVKAHRAYERRIGWDAARRSYLTGEEARRLLNDESPVRVWREKRGMTQRALAEAADMSVSYLAEIESGKKPGSADAFRRIAGILGVAMEDLAAAASQPADLSFQPIGQSQIAAEKLVKLAKSGVSRERMSDEARAIISGWLQVADREGVRHRVRAAIGALQHRVSELTKVALLPQYQGQTGRAGTERSLGHASELAEAALDALKQEYRKL